MMESENHEEDLPAESEDSDAMIARLLAMKETPDGRASDEERALFFKILGIPPPCDDKRIPPPDRNDCDLLARWLQNRNSLSEEQRTRVFTLYHNSASWREVATQLSKKLGTIVDFPE